MVKLKYSDYLTNLDRYTVACPEGGLRGLQPPAAPKYLPFSDRELRFEKNLTVLAPILTEIRFFKIYNFIIRNNELMIIQRRDQFCKNVPLPYVISLNVIC